MDIGEPQASEKKNASCIFSTLGHYERCNRPASTRFGKTGVPGRNRECGRRTEATLRARAADGCVSVQYETFRLCGRFEVSSDTSNKLRSVPESWKKSRVPCFTSPWHTVEGGETEKSETHLKFISVKAMFYQYPFATESCTIGPSVLTTRCYVAKSNG